MGATIDAVSQSHPSQPKPKNVQKTFWTDSQGDAQLDALAALNDCSQGALLRSLIEETYTEAFDDLNPQHIEQGRVSVEDLQALANDELTVDELDLETNTTDSVTEYEPNSYYLTVTPDDLAEPGPELDWETLRNAVTNPEDGGYWHDDLEIHESRIGEETLKASHRPTARILTALARSKATENGILPRPMIEDLIDEYCLHLTNRITADEQERGKAHIRETYTELVAAHLYENPAPTAESYYRSKNRLEERLQAEVDTSQTVRERADMITDIDAWKARQKEIANTDSEEVAADLDSATDEEVRQMWIEDLVYWMGDLARAKHVGRMHAAALQSGEYDNPAQDDKAAFNALHSNLHDAREQFDELSADVKVTVIESLDDALLAAAHFD
ncbi:hypothetical protein [Haladaptatus sp. CMAA 1911]|uniref:hypothetical protein n=1 Tax=unclassified Haladaptatus TaxID=2622732 RepID=UPI003754BB59